MAIGTPPDNVGFAGYGTTNIAISIFQMASCLPSNVIITVSP
jgi:hypothetical protein